EESEVIASTSPEPLQDLVQESIHIKPSLETAVQELGTILNDSGELDGLVERVQLAEDSGNNVGSDLESDSLENDDASNSMGDNEHGCALFLAPDREGVQDQLQIQLDDISRRVLPMLYNVELILNDLERPPSSNLAELREVIGRLQISIDKHHHHFNKDSSALPLSSHKQNSQDSSVESTIAQPVLKRVRRGSGP
ncbi:hypothetical protein FRC03_005703, partial [Tulasnella sp. 419]